MHDAPVIKNCMGTGSPFSSRENERLDAAEELLSNLEEERCTVAGLALLDQEVRDEALGCYDEEIKKCKRNIAYWNGEAR